VAGPEDLTTLMHQLVQQQAAFAEQQAALLQLQAETARLQRLLIERACGASGSDRAAAPVAGSSTGALAQPPPSAEASAEAETRHQPEEEHEDSPPGNPPELYLISNTPMCEEATAPARAAAPPSTLRAARYLQAVSARAPRAVSRQDVDRLSRLHEVGEAAHLVLHFGEHKGTTLLQVARNDPDYVRRLALTAQRPQVRAAARELVVAIEASEQAAQRGRAKTRRARADGR
jgi:hypothetical protein